MSNTREEEQRDPGNVNNRKELIFGYLVTDTNPNGDPDAGNRPRVFADGHVRVTDVRLKRTIRDYLLQCDERILCHQTRNDDGTVLTMGDRAVSVVAEELDIDENDITRENLLEWTKNLFIDVRAFGAAITAESKNVSITGPVQFTLGRSLEQPDIQTHSITSCFASGEGKGQGTIGSYHTVDRATIIFPGHVCPYNAAKSHLTEDDLQKVYEGMWEGTATLTSRSKAGQVPLLLLVVEMDGPDAAPGLLGQSVTLAEDGNIDLTNVVERMKGSRHPIAAIKYRVDPDAFPGDFETYFTSLWGDAEGLPPLESI